MPPEDPTPEVDAVDPADHDDHSQAILLDLLVHEHPGAFAPDEIRRHFEPHDHDSFYVRDAFDRAARDLVSYGLARYQGELVTASRAAVRASHLFSLLS